MKSHTRCTKYTFWYNPYMNTSFHFSGTKKDIQVVLHTQTPGRLWKLSYVSAEGKRKGKSRRDNCGKWSCKKNDLEKVVERRKCTRERERESSFSLRHPPVIHPLQPCLHHSTETSISRIWGHIQDTIALTVRFLDSLHVYTMSQVTTSPIKKRKSHLSLANSDMSWNHISLPGFKM